MKTLKVRWKNFNSYGNVMQELDFSNKGSLNLLIGENGHGKSTIGEVLEFAYFGKVSNKTLGSLPNRINKELWVEIDSICRNGKRVKIERGVSPSIFNLTIDGEEFDQAGKSNVQGYLEDELYDIPHKVFKNILVLNIDDFKSFITMSNTDKRNIIDKLFGFSLINQMRDIIKNERKVLRDEIKTNEDELNIISEAIESITSKLDDLSVKQDDDKNSKILSIKDELKVLKSTKDDLQQKINSISDKESRLNELLKSSQDNLRGANNSINSKNKKINLLSNSCCPQCERPWDSDDIDHKKHLEEEVNKLNRNIPTFQSEVNDSKENVRKLKSFEIEINRNLSSINTEIKTLVSRVKALIEEDPSNQFEHLKSLLNENTIKSKNKKSLKLEKGQQDIFLQLAENVLGDEGAKNLALKSILPALNANISTMSAQMHIPHSIRFDEKFDCIITSLGEEISPKTLSSGQRKKTDFIIVISLIKLMVIRYPNLNILFLDELLQSVDAGGRHEILKILREIVSEYKIDTWVINHSELPIEKFDKVAKAVLEGGFSKMEIENVE
tara:strand:+ start:1107 stop:2774 length:1668 start_codon:yes stop_codon:yes gene_type:complete